MNYRDRKLEEELQNLVTRTWAWLVRMESTGFINGLKIQVWNCVIYLIKNSHICEFAFAEKSSYLSISNLFSSTNKRNCLSSRLTAWNESLPLKDKFFWNYYFDPRIGSMVWNAWVIDVLHPATRRRSDVVMTSLCPSQGRHSYVSNEIPNNVSVELRQDVSVVRLHDILLERRGDVSRGLNNNIPSVRLLNVSNKSQMKHPRTSQWYVTKTSQWYISLRSK